MSLKKSRIVYISLVLILLLGVVVQASPARQSWSAFDKRIAARVDGDRLIEHIRVLSEDIGPRVPGTEEEWQAAEYIAVTLESYGYEVEVQKTQIGSSDFKRTLTQLTPIEKELSPDRMTGSGDAPEGIIGDLVFVGLGIEDEEFPDDLSGKIALIERDGKVKFRDKAQKAYDRGALGVIIFNNESGSYTGTLNGDFPIPVVSLSRNEGSYLVEELSTSDVEVRLVVGSSLIYSPNVIASKPAKHKDANDQIVMFTAQLDSVANSPGANDNASGVAGVLEMARILRSYQSVREVRFALLGAENIGLAGTSSYVAGLSEEELSRIVAVYNMDMIGTSWGDDSENLLVAWTWDGQRNIVTDTAIAAGARLSSAVLPAKATRIEHNAFHHAGIPIASFLRLPIESDYQQPTDTIEMNIEKDLIVDSVKIVGSAAYELIRPGSSKLENSKIGNVIKDIEDNLDAIIEENIEAY